MRVKLVKEIKINSKTICPICNNKIGHLSKELENIVECNNCGHILNRNKLQKGLYN